MHYSVKSTVAAFAALAALSIGSVAVAQPAAAEPVSSVVLQAAPKGAQLSAEEQAAIDNKNAGKPYDKQAYNRAMQKIKQAEKYEGDRNKQKRGRK
ncbi:hypothetical protein [Nocardia brasiliensis]|uniref:hypothetical protein n=1 Tax=Nocardia brasiliensis TaxID=37326 RepID=UPI0004A6AE7A|nr:hypothetical protein [Nocardia brasiliensis]